MILLLLLVLLSIIFVDNSFSALQQFRIAWVPSFACYFVIRNFNLDSKSILPLFRFAFFGIIISTILFLTFSFENNFNRQSLIGFGSLRLITLSYFFALGISYLIYFKKQNFTTYFLTIFILLALLLTYTRAVVAGLIILLLALKIINIRKAYSKSVKFISILLATSFIFSISFIEVNYDNEINDLKEIQKTSSRFTKEIIVNDIYDRISLWKETNVNKNALEIIFGNGLSEAAAGFIKNKKQYYGTAHNFIISIYNQLGSLGILLFISILNIPISQLLRVLSYNKNHLASKFYLLNMLLIILIGLSNDLFTGNRLLFLFLFLTLSSNLSFKKEINV